MRKLITTIWLTSIILLISAQVSISKPYVYTHTGEIDGLVFTFDPPLLADLPGIGPLNVGYVEIETSGSELIAITKSGRYFYFGVYGPGTIYVWSELDEYGEPVGNPVEIPMNSGMLIESFTMDGPIPPDDPNQVPPGEDLNLFFQATIAPEGVDPYDFGLTIINGEIVFAGIIP